MRTVIFASAIALAIFAAQPPSAAAAQNITLGWDSSPDPDIASYNVRYGLASGQYAFKVPSGTNTAADINGLIEGMTYYFVVTACDLAGIESDPSNELGYTVPGIAAPGAPWLQANATGSTLLKWNASPSPNVAGYYVAFVPANGADAMLVYSGNATQLNLASLTLTNSGSFVVSAYDDAGEVSVSTTKIAVAAPLPNTAVIGAAPVLALKPAPAAGLPNVFSVTATGAVPAAWALEASSDLKTWGTISTGSNAAVDVTVVVSPKPKLFFRLNSPLPDAQLQAQTSADALPHSLCVHTAQAAPPTWTVESSENLQDWNQVTAGSGTDVNVAVVPGNAAAFYFRLKSR